MKYKVVGIIVCMLLISTVLPISSTEIEEISCIPTSIDGKTLYVGGSGPGNYTKIQDAIDDASDGDTVFVYDDSSPYNEYLIIDKSINLIGEKKDTTIINGDNQTKQHILRITANGVNLHGFTIQNSRYTYFEDYAGIAVYSNNNDIFGNVLTNNCVGIVMNRASRNKIHENIITIAKQDGPGIRLVNGKNNEIFNNTISEVGIGIIIHYSPSNKIYRNSLAQIRWSAIDLREHGTWFTKIYKNVITGAKYGINLLFSFFNFIEMNEINSCREYGFCMHHTKFTFVMKNNFINNSCNAYFFGKRITNRWIRNYWDDWDGLRFYQIDGEDYNIMDPMSGDYKSVKQYDRNPTSEPYPIEV